MRAERARLEAGIDREDMCRWAPAAIELSKGLISLAPTPIVRWIIDRWFLGPMVEWRRAECPGRPDPPTHPLLGPIAEAGEEHRLLGELAAAWDAWEESHDVEGAELSCCEQSRNLFRVCREVRDYVVSS